MTPSPKEFADRVVSDSDIAIPVYHFLARRRQLRAVFVGFVIFSIVMATIQILFLGFGAGGRVFLAVVWLALFATFCALIRSRIRLNVRQLASEVPVATVRRLFGMTTVVFSATVSRQDVVRAIEDEFRTIKTEKDRKAAADASGMIG